MHLADISTPRLTDISYGRGVWVKVLRVGVDGTDKEINAAEYGAAPPGERVLVIGHESFSVVEEVGPHVTDLVPGDFVVATVRRPGASIYDQIGTYDMTTDEQYFERGINLRHGFLTEYYVDDAEYMVKVPPGLQEEGVLLEPTSLVQKGIAQAFEIQRRLRVWRPKRAAVLGAGPIGLLATMVLRLKGIQVCRFALPNVHYLNSNLIEEIGGCYHSTKDLSLSEASKDHGPYDLIVEATDVASLVFEAMGILGKTACWCLQRCPVGVVGRGAGGQDQSGVCARQAHHYSQPRPGGGCSPCPSAARVSQHMAVTTTSGGHCS